MARNGSGTYIRAVSPYTAGTTISAGTVNSEMDDIALALTQSMSRDGQSPATANIPMGGFRLTGVGNAIANTDAAPLGQVVAKAGDTMSGALGVIAGTAAAPGLSVSGDANTGVFQPAADTLAVSVGGAEVARFSATATIISVGGVQVARFDANGLQSASPWVDVASAATTDLGAQTSDNLRITGTTTITSFGTAANGVTRHLRFADALTLTHNATSLILPGGANITTAAGDTGTAKSLGSGNWVLTDFQRASALPILPGLITSSGLTIETASLLGRYDAGTGAIQRIPLANTAAAVSLGINRDTEKTATGVNVDFPNIPAGVRRVTVLLRGVSTNGSSNLVLQLGTSSSVEVTGYAGSARAEGLGSSSLTTGVPVFIGVQAAQTYSGRITCELIAGNTWIITGLVGSATGQTVSYCSYDKTLVAVLDRLRITTVNGTDTFDAGTINIMSEF